MFIPKMPSPYQRWAWWCCWPWTAHARAHRSTHSLWGSQTWKKNGNVRLGRRTNRPKDREATQHFCSVRIRSFLRVTLKSFKPLFSVADYNHGNKENQFGQSRKSVTAAHDQGALDFHAESQRSSCDMPLNVSLRSFAADGFPHTPPCSPHGHMISLFTEHPFTFCAYIMMCNQMCMPESSPWTFTQNICTVQSSIMNASCINIPTQTGAEQEVADKEAQELLMKTYAGLSALILTVMALEMEVCNIFWCQHWCLLAFSSFFLHILPQRSAKSLSKVWN